MKLMNWLKIGTAAVVLSVSVMACVSDATDLIEDDDVVELLENALNSKAGGFDAQMTDMLALVENYQNACGQTFDSTYSKTNGLGSLITYGYTYAWAGTVNCDTANAPQTINFSYSSSGNYTAPRMSSSDNGTYSIVVSGLQPSNSNYSLGGTYTRIGTQTTKIRNEFSFTATLGVGLTDLTVEKTTKDIKSGTGTFTVTGETSGGESITYDGSLTYNDDNTVTVNFNGKDYTINLD